MRAVVTGADGFLGWHVRCRARAEGVVSVLGLDRAGFLRLDEALEGADAVVHVAGVNRGEPGAVRDGNVELAEAVAGSVRRARQPLTVVHANTVLAGDGSAYGDSKAVAAQLLAEAAQATGSRFVDVRLPNLFGEHARPDYNSFVATFCRDVALGRVPAVRDRRLRLLHVQSAAQVLLSAATSGSATGPTCPPGHQTSVGEVLSALRSIKALYDVGDLPDLSTDFATDLFNTYRAGVFPGNAPLVLPRHADHRGQLVECVRAHGRGGQTFVSTTAPGITRGDHFHLRKIERFVVIEGTAEISLRRMFTERVHTFRVSGDDAVAVDMPTMWAHNVKNVGSATLVMLFWTDRVFDPGAPDTCPEPVDSSRLVGADA